MKRVKVILNEDVYNLGEEGDVRDVAPGFARNFLIPQGLALGYSKKNVSYFEQRKVAIEKRKDEKREAAKSFREKIETKVLELEMPAGDTGKLFGSVNSATIAEKLAAEGINIERKKIDVPESSIKIVGEYDVRIRLYGDEVAAIKVIVNPVGGKKAETTQPTGDAAPAEEPVVDEAAAVEETSATPEDPKEEEATSAEPAESAVADEAQAEEAPSDAPVEEPVSAESTAPDTTDESADSEGKSS
jgi:large subunit ribosomal protein L9